MKGFPSIVKRASILVMALIGGLSPLLLASEKPKPTPLVVTHPDVHKYFHADNPEYEVPLIARALELTKKDYGDYELKPMVDDEIYITHARRVKLLEENRYENFVLSHGYERRLQDKLAMIRFPLYLGLLSYRTCFVGDAIKDKFGQVQTLDELREYGQGIGVGWSEGKLFKHNGFRVHEISSLESLYKMTAANRVDVFCRGATEVLDEFGRFGNKKGLHYDKKIAIYYPMPIFLYTNKANTALIERLEVGLSRAYADGSLQTLWDKNFKESIDFQGFEDRKVFVLDNPLTNDIDFNFELYFYYRVDRDQAAQ